MSLTILIVISPSHGKRRYTANRNDYRYANHKKWATENAFVLQYHMTPDITPYIEYDYLDRQGVYNGRDNLSENSYRIGVSFKL